MKRSLKDPFFKSAVLNPIPAQVHSVEADPEYEWALSCGRERLLLTLVVLVGVFFGAYVYFPYISSLVQHYAARIAAGR